MDDYISRQAAIDALDGESFEPAKSILENMDAILKELGTELRRIDDVIYSPSNVNSNSVCDVNDQQDDCLLQTLGRHRNLAESLLKIAVHIREGLC